MEKNPGETNTNKNETPSLTSGSDILKKEKNERKNRLVTSSSTKSREATRRRDYRLVQARKNKKEDSAETERDGNLPETERPRPERPGSLGSATHFGKGVLAAARVAGQKNLEKKKKLGRDTHPTGRGQCTKNNKKTLTSKKTPAPINKNNKRIKMGLCRSFQSEEFGKKHSKPHWTLKETPTRSVKRGDILRGDLLLSTVKPTRGAGKEEPHGRRKSLGQGGGKAGVGPAGEKKAKSQGKRENGQRSAISLRRIGAPSPKPPRA